jgi:hypothetical protein
MQLVVNLGLEPRALADRALSGVAANRLIDGHVCSPFWLHSGRKKNGIALQSFLPKSWKPNGSRLTSRAFVKDADYLEELPERPVSEHPNDVIESGSASPFRANAMQSKSKKALTIGKAKCAKKSRGPFRLICASLKRSRSSCHPDLLGPGGLEQTDNSMIGIADGAVVDEHQEFIDLGPLWASRCHGRAASKSPDRRR